MDPVTVPDSTIPVISREEARKLGLSLYYTGEPCFNGHYAERYVRCNRCKTCRDFEKKKAKLYGPRCSVEGCDKARDTNGYCPAHYARWKNHGDPLAGGPCNGDGLKWLAKHADYQGDDCLIWPFGKTKQGRNGGVGYGLTYVDGQVVGAHIVMCQIANGPKPTDSHVTAHSCGKGHLGCVHPQHLRWATHKENATDKFLHGTVLCGEEHPNSILTEEEVKQIRALSGVVSRAGIAKLFGVSRGAVYSVVTGRSWSHVDDDEAIE